MIATTSPDLKAYEEAGKEHKIPDQDQNALAFYTKRIDNARDQRNSPRREFDDMDFQQDYAFNQLAAHSYLRKKYNDDDVRVNSGTAEKKIELVLNELLAMNLQPSVRAYDENDREVLGLGDDIGDVVRRTNEMERDEDLYQDAFLELLTQRAVFIEECFSPMPSLTLRTGKESKFKSEKFLNKRLLTGLQVFLGDITIPAYRFSEQPYICVYDRMLYSEAQEIYGDLDAWKYVQPGKPMSDAYGLWFKYRLGVLEDEEVEVIRYFSRNEYMVVINGVMMYKPGNKPYWRTGGYPISMVVLKSMSRFFAYGRPLIASAKFLQGLSDETLRNLIRKMRQGIEPPLGVGTGRIYSKDIYSPGAVTQGLPDGSFSRIIDHDGVTNSEFAMFQLISTKIDEFIGASNIVSGAGGDPTATQVIEQQKQALKMLGLAVLAAMRMKRDLTYQRISSIFEYYMDPIGRSTDPVTLQLKPKYRAFTVAETSIDDGEIGTKLIQFSDTSPTPELLEAQLDAEDRAEDQGTRLRFRTLNVEKLKNVPLTWYVTVNSEERNSGALDKVLFQDKIAQASNLMQMTGVTLNKNKVLDSFERTWKDKGLFEREAPVAPGGAMGAASPEGMLQSLAGMGGVPEATPMGKQLMPKPGGVTPGAKALAMNSG